MKHVKFVRDLQRDKDDGQYIYKCESCGQIWKLKDPDNAFRGYFLKMSTSEKVEARLTVGQKVGLGFLGLIMIRAIYYLLAS